MRLIPALTILFILTTSNLVLALSLKDLPEGTSISGQNINIKADIANGSFKYLTYVISSTGATSGIRYRTSAITVTVGGHTAVIDISSLVGTAPKGQSLYSLITVTKEDIIKAIGEQYRNDVLQANPENINIGAHIQIYNAGTGAVLATITNRNDVASVAGGIGFGSKDIDDMKTRWQENAGSGSTVVIDPEPEGNKSGLRPSILVN